MGSGPCAPGIFVCIGPWNFPWRLRGRIAAALAARQLVLAKPTEQTPIIAARAAEVFREAAYPQPPFNFCQVTAGRRLGWSLTAADPQDHWRLLHRLDQDGAANPTRHWRPMRRQTPTLILAGPGGLNDDRGFDRAADGRWTTSSPRHSSQPRQRCSALRMLYVQEDTRDRVVRC